jgi:hypothetical protein
MTTSAGRAQILVCRSPGSKPVEILSSKALNARISKTKVQSTGHPLVAYQTPTVATDSAGHLYQAIFYITLRWFVRDDDSKSYEECFYVVEGGPDSDAILGASALQEGKTMTDSETGKRERFRIDIAQSL